MTKLLLFVLIATSFYTTCKSTKSKVAFKANFDSLHYSAYRWRISPKEEDWELYIAYYIAVGKDGKFLAMRHNTSFEPALYFEGNINDSLRVLIDDLPANTLDTSYFGPKEIYDGNTFILNISSKTNRHKIDFYQDDAPSNLQKLSYALDNVIFKSNNDIQPFDMEAYKNYLQEVSLKALGGLPKKEPPNIELNTRKY